MFGEGWEEVLSDALNPVLKSIYNDKSVSESYTENFDFTETAYNFAIGSILGGIGGAIEIPKNYQDLTAEKERAVIEKGKRIDNYYSTVSKYGVRSNEAQDALAVAEDSIVRSSTQSVATPVIDAVSDVLGEHGKRPLRSTTLP